MSGYILKAAERQVRCTMDWRRGYLHAGEAVAADLGWTVTPHDGTPGDLVVVEQHHDPARSWAEFRGGREGVFYMVASRVRTSEDRVLERAIVMRIAKGPAPDLRSFR
jgi:hypothetical protein